MKEPGGSTSAWGHRCRPLPQRSSGCEHGATEGGREGVLARWALWPEVWVLPGGLPQTASS